MRKTPFFKFVISFLIFIALGLVGVYGARFLQFAESGYDLRPTRATPSSH